MQAERKIIADRRFRGASFVARYYVLLGGLARRARDLARIYKREVFGLPNKAGRKTEQERVFVEAMAATGDRSYSARVAGYAQPGRDAGRALARPAIQAEIARIQTEKLFTEALPAAVQCLVSIIRNDKAPSGARVQAAKVVLDRTLGSDKAARAKEPSEMSPDELAREIEKLTRIASDRAKAVIDIEPAPAPSNQVDDSSIFD